MPKIVLLSSLILFLSISTSIAQRPWGCNPMARWLPADMGLRPDESPVRGTLAGMPSAMIVHEGRLYLLHGGSSGSYAISTWNGAEWHDSIPLTTAADALEGMASIGGSLYVYGHFNGIDGKAIHGLARWSGSTWESDGLPAGSTVVGTAEFRGEPYLIDGGRMKLLRRHAAVWRQVAEFRSIAPGNGGGDIPNPGFINVMAVGSDGLYVGGSFDSAGGIAARNVARWDGSSFHRVGDPPVSEVSMMRILGNEIYAGEDWDGNDPMLRWDGSTWHVATRLLHGPQRIMGSHRGMLYSTAVSGPAGSRSLTRWNKDSVERLSEVVGTPYGAIEYGGELYLYGEVSSSCDVPIGRVAKLCADGCGTIGGRIYGDDNGDCANDPAEPRLPGILVAIAPGDHMSITDRDGAFREPVIPGTYTLRPIPPRYWRICNGPRTVSLTSADGRVEGIEFGAQLEKRNQDVRISLACGQARAGAPLRYSIRYAGVGALRANGTVRLTLDDGVDFIGSTPPPTRDSGKVIEWDFQDITMFEARDIQVVTSVSPTVPDNTRLHAAADISITTANDAFEADNHDSTYATVNDVRGFLTVSSTPGYDDNRIYDLAPADTVLSYTVRLRNITPDTITSLVIHDTLGPPHDPGSIVFGAASHPYTASFIGYGALRITFTSVDLAGDSTGGGGECYIKFSLGINGSPAPGTLIPYHALAFLDNNAMMASGGINRVPLRPSSVPSTPSRERITIAPNPTGGRTLLTLGEDGGTVELHTLLGERLRTWTTASRSIELDLAGLAPGVYLVRATTVKGAAEERLMIVR